MSWGFVDRIYGHCTSTAEGLPVIKGRDYQVIVPGWTVEQGKEVERFGLKYGETRIAGNLDKQALETWRDIHSELLGSAEFADRSKNLVSQYEKLEDLAEKVRQRLRIEIERGTFDRGQCQLCQ